MVDIQDPSGQRGSNRLSVIIATELERDVLIYRL